jgi:hypothetical protein
VNRTINVSGRRRLTATGLVAVLALPGCSTARLPVPDALAGSERMAVSGRQGLRLRESLRFGPYEAHQVSRSWTRGRDRGEASATASDRSQSFRFVLREAGHDHWHVACHASVTRLRIDAVVVDVHPTDESALYCNLESVERATTAWTLELRERRDRPLSGHLAVHAQRLEVVGTNRLERSLPLGTTSGYEIRETGTAVAAVEVINHGAVWLREDQDPERRRLLSAVAAALLLLEDLRERLED